MCEVTPSSSCELPHSVQAPSLARRFVESTICREHGEQAEAVVTLLVDELVTQAVLYGAPPVSVRLTCELTEFTIEVSDASMHSDKAGPDQELSVMLVDKISTSWGTTTSDDGTTVWCRVPSGALPRWETFRPWDPARTDSPVTPPTTVASEPGTSPRSAKASSS